MARGSPEGGAERHDAVERDLDHVAGREVARRVHRVADAARGAGRDQVAGRQLDDLRDVGDERLDAEDQVADRRPPLA